MSTRCGLRRRYRGLLKPSDRAWHRWLKSGKPKRWGRERVARGFRRLDFLAIYMVLLMLASVGAPVLILHAAVRRPFTFRAFVCSATAFITLGVLLTIPLWTGSVEGQPREVCRDRATLIFLILGTWIAFTYQKRSSDLAAVRDLYHQWLEVQSRAIQATVLLGRPAVSSQQLRVVRDERPDLIEPLGQRLLEQGRDAQIAIQDAAHRSTEIARRASSLRLWALNEDALRVSDLLNSHITLLLDWQQEIVGVPAQNTPSQEAVQRKLHDIHRACEKVTQGLEIWLRT